MKDLGIRVDQELNRNQCVVLSQGREDIRASPSIPLSTGKLSAAHLHSFLGTEFQ